MAISTKLMMRQGQALVMTPQLLQAIKLLQFSNLELAAFLHDELERNPLLEAQEGDGGVDAADPSRGRGAERRQRPLKGRRRATGRSRISPSTPRRSPPISAPT